MDKLINVKLNGGSNIMNTTRGDHMKWCKTRALEYIDSGDIDNAFGSLVSDLNKHSETAGHMGIMLGMQLKMSGKLSSIDEMKKFIVGFN